MAENISFLRIEALLEDVSPKQVAVEPTDDADLGFRMWGGKDTTGAVTKWLAKNKPGMLFSLILTSQAGTDSRVAKVLPSGEVVAETLGASDVPNHNSLNGLQGGSSEERYHITLVEKNNLHLPITLASASGPLSLSGQQISFLFGSGLRLESGSLVVDTANIIHGELAGLDQDDHPQYTRADGTRAFTGRVKGLFPSEGSDLATKDYVDAMSSGAVDFLDSVKGFTSSEPLSPVVGDRWITDAVWGGFDLGAVVQWNGASWESRWNPNAPTAPGARVYVETEGKDFRFPGVSIGWVAVPEVILHSELLDLQEDDHPQYIKADGTRDFTGAVKGVAGSDPSNLATLSQVMDVFHTGSPTVFYLDVVDGDDSNDGLSRFTAKKTTSALVEAIRPIPNPKIVHVIGSTSVVFTASEWSQNVFPSQTEVRCEHDRIYVDWVGVTFQAPTKIVRGTQTFKACQLTGFVHIDCYTMNVQDGTMAQFGTHLFVCDQFNAYNAMGASSPSFLTQYGTINLYARQVISMVVGASSPQWINTACTLILSTSRLSNIDYYSFKLSSGRFYLNADIYEGSNPLDFSNVSSITTAVIRVGELVEVSGNPPWLVAGAQAGSSLHVSAFIGNANGRGIQGGDQSGTITLKVTEAGSGGGGGDGTVLVNGNDTVSGYLDDKLAISTSGISKDVFDDGTGNLKTRIGLDFVTETLELASIGPGFPYQINSRMAAIASFDRCLSTGMGSLSGGVQGSLILVANAPLHSTKVNRMGTLVAQGYGGARGRMGLYVKQLGSTLFQKIAETGEVSFASAGWVEAELVTGDCYLGPNSQLFLGIATVGDPMFLTYSGYNANSPYQIGQLVPNLWNQPVPTPVPTLPTTMNNQGSTTGTRMFVVAFYSEGN